MPVVFQLPGPLRPYAGGRAEVACDLSSGTLRDALAALAELHPALVDRVLTERGEVRPHVNLFVDDEDVRYMGGLAARVPDGATIWIVPAVSGGGGRTVEFGIPDDDPDEENEGSLTY